MSNFPGTLRSCFHDFVLLISDAQGVRGKGPTLAGLMQVSVRARIVAKTLSPVESKSTVSLGSAASRIRTFSTLESLVPLIASLDPHRKNG